MVINRPCLEVVQKGYTDWVVNRVWAEGGKDWVEAGKDSVEGGKDSVEAGKDSVEVVEWVKYKQMECLEDKQHSYSHLHSSRLHHLDSNRTDSPCS